MACGILLLLWVVVAMGDCGDMALVLVAGCCWVGVMIDGGSLETGSNL